MNVPRFPEDFRVLHAEGASYWWWSPTAPADFDGTVAAGEPWPAGLIVGDGQQSHELVAGEEFSVIWMDGDLNPVERMEGVYDPTEGYDLVNRYVIAVLASVDVLEDLVSTTE